MHLSVTETQAVVEPLQTRMPFAFGEVTIRALPHVLVELSVNVDGDEYVGLAADHAVPKWFRKDPETSVADDIEDILAAVEHACATATEVTAESAFEFWYRVYDAQSEWDRDRALPPLLAGFGVTFVERAVIEAVCRHTGLAFHEAVTQNVFGVEPGRIYPETEGMDLGDVVPDRPSRSIAVRHTVGMADPLTEREIDEPVDDDLPETLEGYVEADGVRYVKCKLGGDPEADLERLEDVASVLDGALDEYGVTLDANEQYRSTDALHALGVGLQTRPALDRFTENVVCLEQPLDREFALTPEAGEVLDAWDGPPVIVDESDGEIDDFGRALDIGYDGTSVKSCKGVFKGLVNACLATHREQSDGRSPLLTGEDLTAVGPVSLQEDLALMATLGFDHVERNGHHYVRGLDAFPADVGERTLERHGDLYGRTENGVVTLDIDEGRIRLDSVVDAPYGRAVDIDLSGFTSTEEWSPDVLGL